MTDLQKQETQAEEVPYENAEDGQEEVAFDDDAHKDRFMTFLIGEQNYGVDIMHVTEIVGLQDIAEVPDVPVYVKGMINLRGNVIPVIDVRSRFGMEEREYDARTCVVVVTVEDHTVGMIVDRVNEVAVFPEQNISPAPQRSEGTVSSDYICGLGKQGEDVTILLDTSRLIGGEKITA